MNIIRFMAFLTFANTLWLTWFGNEALMRPATSLDVITGALLIVANMWCCLLAHHRALRERDQ